MKSEIEKLYDIVEEVTGLKLKSRKKNNDHVLARLCFYVLARDLLEETYTLSLLGKMTGRNHETVINAYNNTHESLCNDFIFKSWLKRVSELYKAQNEIDKDLTADIKITKSELNNAISEVREELAEKYKNRIYWLERKLSEYQPNSLHDEISSLNPEQYIIFSERAKIIIKSLKSIRTHENTSRSSFNVKQDEYKVFGK